MSTFRSAEQSLLRNAAAVLVAPEASSASAAVLRASTLRHSGVRHSAPRSCFSPDCTRGLPPRSTHAPLPSGGGVHRRHPASWLASRQRHGRVSLSSSSSSTTAEGNAAASACRAPPPALPPPARANGLQPSSSSASSSRLRGCSACVSRDACVARPRPRVRRGTKRAAAATPRRSLPLRRARSRDGSSCVALRRAAAAPHAPWRVGEGVGRATEQLRRRLNQQRGAARLRQRRRGMAQDGIRHAVVRPAQVGLRLQLQRRCIRRLRLRVVIAVARAPIQPRQQVRPAGLSPLLVHLAGARGGSHASRAWESGIERAIPARAICCRGKLTGER